MASNRSAAMIAVMSAADSWKPKYSPSAVDASGMPTVA